VPFVTLTYILVELNYAGRLTDQWHRRAFNNVLIVFFAENSRLALEQRYPTQGFVVIYQQVIETIGAWPAATERSDVGLSLNASTIVEWKE
jgi:hypothetical protein